MGNTISPPNRRHPGYTTVSPPTDLGGEVVKDVAGLGMFSIEVGPIKCTLMPTGRPGRMGLVHAVDLEVSVVTGARGGSGTAVTV